MSAMGKLGAGNVGDQALTTQLLQQIKRIADALSPTVYEQGEWTPTLFGSTGAGAPTYTIQVGSFEKFGRSVIARFAITISAIGGMTGNLRIGGLPFVPNTLLNDNGTIAFGASSNVTLDAGYTQLAGSVDAQTNYGHVMESGSGVPAANVPIANVASTTALIGALFYRTD